MRVVFDPDFEETNPQTCEPLYKPVCIVVLEQSLPVLR
jgi:hypothetical protein